MTRAAIEHRVVNHRNPPKIPVLVKQNPHACVVSGCEELFKTKPGRALHLAAHMGAE